MCPRSGARRGWGEHLELGAAEVDEGGGAEAGLQAQLHLQLLQRPLPADRQRHLRAKSRRFTIAQDHLLLLIVVGPFAT